LLKNCLHCKTDFVPKHYNMKYCPFCKSRFTESQLYYNSHPQQRKKQIRTWYAHNKEHHKEQVKLWRDEQRRIKKEIEEKLKEMLHQDVNEQYS
jgi:hypothetical protein